MLGLHPEEVRADWRDQLAEIKKCINTYLHTNQSPIPSGGVGGGLLAIGEVGLDFYWSREFEQKQLLAFEEQVRWSVELQLPLMIHCRKAQNEMVAILKKNKDQLPGGVFHCFTGNTTEARQLLDFDRFVLGIVTGLTWKLKEGYDHNDTAGVYFLQTNLDGKDGLTVWTIYNILKEVESSFRCMKTDLNLRPVFHKKDKPCLAHLHLGILAYWVVATIRYQLKQKGYTKGWTQIVDIMDTQHSVATEMKNLQGDTIHIESPTEPTEQVREICEKVGISPIPYKMKKSVGVQISEQKNEGKENQGVIEPDISNTG